MLRGPAGIAESGLFIPYFYCKYSIFYLTRINICNYITFKHEAMSIVKVIEVIASSETGFDDAVRNAVKEVSRTIKNIDSVYVKDLKAHVKDGEVVSYGAICKVAFRVEHS